MYAIVTAGGTPLPDDPLFDYSQGKPKAMLDIAGKPMAQWVLDAISAAESIQGIVLIGLQEDIELSVSKPLRRIPDQAGMLENILAGVEMVQKMAPGPQQILVSSSDIPALKPEMVDWLVEAAAQTDDDLYYNVVTRQVMEKRFPESKRTYIKLKDAEVCGGDMNMLHTRAVDTNLDFWREVIASRKNYLKQARMIGFDVLFGVLTHSITLQETLEKVCRRIHMKGRALVSPYAEIAMDVDKPRQLDMMRRDLEQAH
jgi:GTP:adenosylcobinamide-phosphate guanylyltransferase